MIEQQTINFIIDVNNAILRGIVALDGEPAFTLEFEENDDAQFHIDIIKKVANALKLRALCDYSNNQVDVYLKDNNEG